MKGIRIICFLLVSHTGAAIAESGMSHLMDLRLAASSGNRESIRAARTALIDALDSEKEGIEYVEAIEELKGNVLAVIGGKQNVHGPLALASAEVLCRIAPWTLGEEDRDWKTSRELYSVFLKAFPRDLQFARFLDCAHANTRKGYFTFLNDYNTIWPERGCRYISKPEEESLKELLQSGVEVSKGLEESLGSYYQPRLSMRVAVIYTALAVFRVQKGDVQGGLEWFAKAYASIGGWRSAKKLRKVRNGWRLHSDIFVHAALYRYLAGEQKEAVAMLEDRGAKWGWVKISN